jgi:hypothetical protein
MRKEHHIPVVDPVGLETYITVMVGRKSKLLVGTLFLTSTAAFMAGSRLIAAYFSGDSRGSWQLLTGVVLEGYCGLAVAGIGMTSLPILNPYAVRLARATLD